MSANSLAAGRDIPALSPLLEARHLSVHFTGQRAFLKSAVFGRPAQITKAVDDVSIAIAAGEIVALIGESGCGKSTLGMSLVHLRSLTSGTVIFAGKEVTNLSPRQLKQFRKSAQIVFQDPFASLNPRLTIEETIAEPLVIHGLGDPDLRRDMVRQVLETVNLTPTDHFTGRYPHELSGGQRQRVAIARAIVLNPDFLVADEPVSMLDVSVRAGVLDIFRNLADKRSLGILYISHDISTVRQIADKVAVMYLGRIVEFGQTNKVFESPRHPYTQALMAAVPSSDPDRVRRRVELSGDIPSPTDAPSGCPFRTRCIHAHSICSQELPSLVRVDVEHTAACHLVSEGVAANHHLGASG